MKTTIRTSEKDWLKQLAVAYKSKQGVVLLDNAGIGIDPSTQSLFTMGQKSGLGAADWVAIVIALGVAAAGAWLIVMAVLDPEPYSKVAFAIGAGAVMTFGGGFGAIRVLTKQRPPTVRAGPKGFEIEWT